MKRFPDLGLFFLPFSLCFVRSLSLFLPPLASSLRSSRTSFPPFPVRDHSARPSHFFPLSSSSSSSSGGSGWPPSLFSLSPSLSRFRSHFLLSSSFSFYFFFGRIRSLLVITRKAGRGAREKRERGWRRGREKEREPVKVCIIRIYICIYIYT